MALAGHFGTHHILFITLDTLRYDVAVRELEAGRTPTLAALIGRWERRHTPASFTYGAHHAFFAGFLPTPPHTRTRLTCIDALRGAGYHTVCIGGVGFFNKLSPLGGVLPALFDESHWSAAMGVTGPDSTRHQVTRARAALAARPAGRRLFLFVNVSALHQPNYMFLPGAYVDSLESHAAALRYADGELAALVAALPRPTLGVICADHGTAYGEGGYVGHRLAHPVVWTVPYAEFELL